MAQNILPEFYNSVRSSVEILSISVLKEVLIVSFLEKVLWKTMFHCNKILIFKQKLFDDGNISIRSNVARSKCEINRKLIPYESVLHYFHEIKK